MLPESSANRSEVMEKRQERVREECAKELGVAHWKDTWPPQN